MPVNFVAACKSLCLVIWMGEQSPAFEVSVGLLCHLPLDLYLLEQLRLMQGRPRWQGPLQTGAQGVYGPSA